MCFSFRFHLQYLFVFLITALATNNAQKHLPSSLLTRQFSYFIHFFFYIKLIFSRSFIMTTTTQLFEYYATNYSQICQKLSYERSYIETPEFLSLCAKIIGILGVPTNFFASYIITFHTPKSMTHLKLCLLNLKFW